MTQVASPPVLMALALLKQARNELLIANNARTWLDRAERIQLADERLEEAERVLRKLG